MASHEEENHIFFFMGDYYNYLKNIYVYLGLYIYVQSRTVILGSAGGLAPIQDSQFQT